MSSVIEPAGAGSEPVGSARSARSGRSTSRRGSLPTGDALVRLVGLGVAATFLLVGILGFVPGITTHYGDLMLAGHHSKAELLGVFQVSVLHNLVHLAFGVVGLGLARTPGGARTYLVGGGLVYFAVWAFGLFTGGEDTAGNLIPLNTADNWLHLALAFGMVLLGTMVGHERPGRGR